MRNAIYEYLEPTIEEKQNLWRGAVFIFGTDVLLNLYRFSKEERDALLRAMWEMRERIWVPYQAVCEFMDHRYEVILELLHRYEDLTKEADTFVNCCKKRLGKTDTNVEQLRAQIKEWILNEQKKEFPISNSFEDEILNQLLDLLDGRVGRKYSEEEMEQIKMEAKERYEKELPFGCSIDQLQNGGEGVHGRYSDLVFWRQILDYAQDQKRDAILVVCDLNEEWWNAKRGKIIGPRAELRKEFYKKTFKKFHMYTVEEFLHRCGSCK